MGGAGRAGCVLLTLVHCKQRRNGALVPDGDEQRPGKHYQHDGQDVAALRHLQGWRGPQLLITWQRKPQRQNSRAHGEQRSVGRKGPKAGGRERAAAEAVGPWGLTSAHNPPIAHAGLQGQPPPPLGTCRQVSRRGRQRSLQDPLGKEACNTKQREWAERRARGGGGKKGWNESIPGNPSLCWPGTAYHSRCSALESASVAIVPLSMCKGPFSTRLGPGA